MCSFSRIGRTEVLSTEFTCFPLSPTIGLYTQMSLPVAIDVQSPECRRELETFFGVHPTPCCKTTFEKKIFARRLWKRRVFSTTLPDWNPEKISSTVSTPGKTVGRQYSRGQSPSSGGFFHVIHFSVISNDLRRQHLVFLLRISYESCR